MSMVRDEKKASEDTNDSISNKDSEESPSKRQKMDAS